jgi:starch phosphorylase
MEFLIGKSLKNNLFNLSLIDACEEYLKISSYSTEEIFAVESDAGLGNGGLGRLAASYLEAMATNSYWGEGYSI